MGLNAITSSALTALQVNSAALGVVSSNVANVNTAGYARRIAELAALSSAGILSGVEISDIKRVVNDYLNREVLSASSSSSLYDTQTTIYDEISALLGSVGDDTSLSSRLSNVFSALGQAALSPTSTSSRISVLNSLTDLASAISSLSSSLSELQSEVDSQVAASVGSANNLIKQIYDLNSQIALAAASGNTASALEDQRDQALQSLAKLIDVRTVKQSDGSLTVMTGDGTSLVGDTYAQLSYTAGGANGVYQTITLQRINPQTGETVGSAKSLDPHLSGGSLKGLIEMRDGALADLQNELGSFAQTVANAFNEVSNSYTSYPPPTTLAGRDTGLLATDALNFSGKTAIAVTDASGNLISRVDVDFDAGTLSVDGGAAVGFGGTIGGFAGALNSALGGNGTASFADGRLTIAASGAGGIVVQDDATTPSSRGGYGFSQFFGLNDLFTTSMPSILATGLSASDSCGLASDGEIDLALKDADGSIVKTASVTITAGMTIGDVVDALNIALGGAATFTLDSDGSITTSLSSDCSDCDLLVANDTTQRGSTGMSLTALFGIGDNQPGTLAASFSVSSAIAGDSSLLPTGLADLSSSGAVIGSDDSSGLTALQNLATARQTFAAAGELGRQVATLGNYAATLFQDVASRAATAEANQATQEDRLAEAQSLQSSTSGVNLDEELSNMIIYQQAYAAAARMLTLVDELYQTLLNI